jgi:hypothetical protein
MVQAMMLHHEEMVRDQLTLDQRINQTRDQGSYGMRKASNTRELEVLIMKIYIDLTSLTLSLDMAALRRLTASLLSSHKLLEILRDIYLQLEQGYTFMATLKPENMHLFYASSETTALATEEAIRLIIQIPLRTERRTYSVYEPIPLPTLEPTLSKFMQIQVGRERLAVSSDRRNYMILQEGYIRNCKGGTVTICVGAVPIIERSYETCLSSLFYGSSRSYSLCTREILIGNFNPVFRRFPFDSSWLLSVARPMVVECKCVGTQMCPLDTMSIKAPVS